MTFYNRDPSVPYWRANVDVDALFENHAHRLERAQAWLRWRYVSESSAEFRQVVMMRGRFEFGLLGYHTYCWSLRQHMPVNSPSYFLSTKIIGSSTYWRYFATTTASGAALPVRASSSAAPQFIGSTAVHRSSLNSPLRVYKTPITWLAAESWDRASQAREAIAQHGLTYTDRFGSPRP